MRKNTAYTFRVVSPQEAEAEVYPYVHVNEDGTARELHASEREYLETAFMPNDSARPYVKERYESTSGWYGISGFCRRAQLPAGIEVAEAPTEDPSRRLTIDDIRDMLQKRYAAPRARNAPAALPAAAAQPPRTDAQPAPTGQQTESRPGRMPWTVGLGVLGTVAVVLLRSAVHHPQLKDPHQRQAVRQDQGERLEGKQSIALPRLSDEEVIQRMNTHRFAGIVACQRRLGVPDEALESLLRRAWRAQHPDEPPPWESEAAGGGDWRTSVTWNVEAVEKALGRLAATPATPSDPGPGTR